MAKATSRLNILSSCFDSFIHQGPNGGHQCLVFELLGPSVDIILEDSHSGRDQLEAEIIIGLSEQLLEGIAFLHEAGLGHGVR
jgi:serine/threonine-protein kinase SRPK3